jgi:SSS family solute:Na+ symporter
MHMPALDWIIVIGMSLLLLVIAATTRRLTRSVSDFLDASRCAGYADYGFEHGVVGTISIAVHFEKFYAAEFGGLWQANMFAPLVLVTALTGFVIY